jgi:hypothetical protein
MLSDRHSGASAESQADVDPDLGELVPVRHQK